jgi:N-acetylglucosaminyldiphosphoundecaprenol N-acetyl-beta-D-mannosaminyltransferase
LAKINSLKRRNKVFNTMKAQTAGGSIKKVERITGSDIFRELSRRLNDRGGASFFFLGSTEETLAAIEARLTGEFPGIRFAGSYSPPFKEIFSEEENRAMIAAVNRAEPGVLWVGMTAPKQEKFIFENRARLNVKFAAAVGAVFDFFVGNIRREEDSWFVNNSLEWLPRLIQEPRRLWRRMFVSAPVFVWKIVRQRFKG